MLALDRHDRLGPSTASTRPYLGGRATTWDEFYYFWDAILLTLGDLVQNMLHMYTIP